MLFMNMSPVVELVYPRQLEILKMLGEDVVNECTIRRLFEKLGSDDFTLENPSCGGRETKVDNVELELLCKLLIFKLCVC